MTDVSYTVRGSWPFPLDMLRRDQSVAATQADQALIDMLCAQDTSALADLPETVEINLVIRDNPKAVPCTPRWASFGWEVPTDVTSLHVREAHAHARRMGSLKDGVLSKLTGEEIEALRYFGLDRRH